VYLYPASSLLVCLFVWLFVGLVVWLAGCLVGWQQVQGFVAVKQNSLLKSIFNHIHAPK